MLIKMSTDNISQESKIQEPLTLTRIIGTHFNQGAKTKMYSKDWFHKVKLIQAGKG